jgi:hypothetical protein
LFPWIHGNTSQILWFYNPNSNLGGYPLILGRPWLATVDAFISCRSRDMTISHGDSIKKFTLYPPTKPSIDQEISQWIDNESSDDEFLQPILSLDQAMIPKEDTKDDLINNFITIPNLIQYPRGQSFDYILDSHFQENCTINTTSSLFDSMSSLYAMS